MVATDQWKIADQRLHGAGYKTLVCCPENALTGAAAQQEGLIAVPFPHVLRRAFAWYSSTDTTAGSDTIRLFRAIPGGTFAVIGTQSAAVVAGNLTVNVAEIRSATQEAIEQEEIAEDTGALYRVELDIVIGTDVFNDFGFGIMVTPIPPGGYQHQQ
jgi:hypothetical protein